MRRPDKMNKRAKEGECWVGPKGCTQLTFPFLFYRIQLGQCFTQQTDTEMEKRERGRDVEAKKQENIGIRRGGLREFYPHPVLKMNYTLDELLVLNM